MNLLHVKPILMLFVFGLTNQALAFNRPEVIRAAGVLAEEVEHFDDALHKVNAPKHLTQKVHHFEETVFEFLDEVKGGCSSQLAYQEFQHIRADYKSIQREMQAHHHLLHYPAVKQEYSMMRRAYRWLDHAMYMHRSNGEYSDETLQDIEVLMEH